MRSILRLILATVINNLTPRILNSEHLVNTGLSVVESTDERTQSQSVALEDEQQEIHEDDSVDFHDLRLRCFHRLRKTV